MDADSCLTGELPPPALSLLPITSENQLNEMVSLKHVKPLPPAHCPTSGLTGKLRSDD